MNPRIRIVIVIFPIPLVDIVGIAVNYGPLPVHAKQYWHRPGNGGSSCVDNRHNEGN